MCSESTMGLLLTSIMASPNDPHDNKTHTWLLIVWKLKEGGRDGPGLRFLSTISNNRLWADAPNRISILGTHCTVMISPTWLASAGVRGWCLPALVSREAWDWVMLRYIPKPAPALMKSPHLPPLPIPRPTPADEAASPAHQHIVTMRSGRHAWHRHITATLSMHHRVWEPVRGGGGMRNWCCLGTDLDPLKPSPTCPGTLLLLPSQAGSGSHL